MSKISVRGRVVYILQLARGQPLSISDIRTVYHRKYNKRIKPSTIAAAIRESIHVNDNIATDTERRYERRIPVSVYRIANQP